MEDLWHGIVENFPALFFFIVLTLLLGYAFMRIERLEKDKRKRDESKDSISR
jgi:hypothetical protein